ncbi:hypothetical protein HPB47_023486 [Ixodes persulcatus]|uniref:Uncharacterized protein n=1 Tax=Ixodes persulcatus TaxID=34615 RepID=A0AC60Q6V4_IXOPE|nr:hypothetical protein HPB47_023486 [Ixodes persulcatus]
MEPQHLSDRGSPAVSWTSASLHHNSAHDGNLNLTAAVVIISRSLSPPQALQTLHIGPAESSIGTNIACTSKTCSQKETLVQVPVSRPNPDLLYLKLRARRRLAQNRSLRTRRMEDIQCYRRIDAAPERAALLSDSRAALQILSNLEDAPPIARSIAFKVEFLEKKGWTIAFQWLPFRCGIDGNERAVRIAAEAHERTNSTLHVPMINEARLLIARETQKKTPGPRPFTASWLYHVKRVDSPHCQTCQVPEDIEHLLCDCPIFDAQRSRLYLELRQIGAARQSLSHLLSRLRMECPDLWPQELSMLVFTSRSYKKKVRLPEERYKFPPFCIELRYIKMRKYADVVFALTVSRCVHVLNAEWIVSSSLMRITSRRVLIMRKLNIFFLM